MKELKLVLICWWDLDAGEVGKGGNCGLSRALFDSSHSPVIEVYGSKVKPSYQALNDAGSFL